MRSADWSPSRRSRSTSSRRRRAQESPARSEMDRPSSGRAPKSSPEPPWDFSQSSTASQLRDRPARSPARRRNPILHAARALVSCFGSHRTRRRRSSDDLPSPLPSPPPTPSTSSSHWSGSFQEKKPPGSYRNRRRRGEPSWNESGGKMAFTMDEILRATKNFLPSLKIGLGGFGTVYRGKLDDGTLVAVKRAKKSIYDNHLGVEFQSEIQMLARVEHLNLVRFFGYLEQDDERIVVVEYVPNGTLREHLDCLHGKPLDLAARLDIAADVAHAVTYLHMYTDHPIIHRDIKSSNILLTENHRAKVADFGFARLGSNETGVTHVSTQVKGTAGYLDPEYLKTYQLTEKSDVYSFGVLLVELVTGRRPIEQKRETRERMTPRWAMKKFAEGNALQTLDPRLSPSPAANLALEKVLELAGQCLATTKHGRPSMRRCAEILWGIRKDYRELLSSIPEESSRARSKNM